jgi:hypothetical protein
MTDTLEPVATPDTTPEPVAKSRRWMWTIPTVVATVVVVGVVLGHVAPIPHNTPTTGICGTWLTVRPTTFNGIALDVDVPGPTTVTVDIWGSFEHRRLFQQVTKNSPGADFMAWNFEYKIKTVEVSLKNGTHCYVADDTIRQLNTANGNG